MHKITIWFQDEIEWNFQRCERSKYPGLKGRSQPETAEKARTGNYIH